MSEKQTLCWNCANCFGNCPWSRNFEPVPGWLATDTKVYVSPEEYVDSFLIHDCPMFVKDTTNGAINGSIRNLSILLGLSDHKIRTKSEEELKEILFEKGYILETVNASRKEGKVVRKHKLIKVDKYNYISPEIAKDFLIHTGLPIGFPEQKFIKINKD